MTTLYRAARLSAYHTSKLVFQRLSIPLAVAVIFQVLLRLLGEIESKKMWLWLLLTLGIYWFLALVIFAANTARGWAGKLPRRLSRRQKRRIISYLKLYRGDERIVNVKVCYNQDREKEKEAWDYANEIISVIRQSGWRADFGNQESYDEAEHSSGLWVYGLNQRGLQEPLTRAIISTAFNKAGVEIHQDRADTMGWTFIVVGHRSKGGAK